MKYGVIGLLGLTALVATGCATRDSFAHTRAQVTHAELISDVTSCRELSRSGAVGPTGTSYNPALGSQAGAAFGAGFAQGMAQAQAQNAGYERCMADRGYLRTPLTPEERAAYRALRTAEEREAWVAEFAARDHSERSTALGEPE